PASRPPRSSPPRSAPSSRWPRTPTRPAGRATGASRSRPFRANPPTRCKPVTDDAARQAQARLDAWRERGGELADPVRFHYLQALARRAARHEGQARQLLDQRLAGLMAACPDTPASAQRAEADQARTPGPLGQLCAQIAAAAPARPAYPELPLLDEFRQTWTRLSTDRQLRQSEQLVPENAGPLNSSHLA